MKFKRYFFKFLNEWNQVQICALQNMDDAQKPYQRVPQNTSGSSTITDNSRPARPNGSKFGHTNEINNWQTDSKPISAVLATKDNVIARKCIADETSVIIKWLGTSVFKF